MGSDVTGVVRGSAHLAIQSIVTTLFGAVALVFRARILSQTEMGIVVALTLVPGIAQMITDLGFARGLAKHIAESRGKKGDYTLVLLSGITAKVLTAGIISLLCVLFAPQLSNLLVKSKAYSGLFQLAGIYVFLVCLYFTTNNLLLGLGKISVMANLNMLRGLTRYSLIIVLLLLGFGLPGLVVSWITSELTHTIPSVFIIFRGGNLKMHSIGKVTSYLKSLSHFSWPLFLSNIMTFLYNWFDRGLLLAYLPLTDVAVYDVAYMAFGVVYMVPTAVSTTLFPYYTEQYGKNKHESITTGVYAASRYIALLFTPLALGLAVVANPTLTLFAGPTYASGDAVLFVLSLSAGIGSLVAALGGLLLVYDMTRMALIINIVSVGVSTAASLLLLPVLGVIGVAIVRGGALILSFLLTFIVVKRRIPIKFDKVALWKSWVGAAVMAIVVGGAAQVFTRYSTIPFLILVGGAVYVGGLRALKAVNEDDIELVQKLLGSRARIISKILRRLLT